MRIGLVAPPWQPLPPPGHGAIELLVGGLVIAGPARDDAERAYLDRVLRPMLGDGARYASVVAGRRSKYAPEPSPRPSARSARSRADSSRDLAASRFGSHTGPRRMITLHPVRGV